MLNANVSHRDSRADRALPVRTHPEHLQEVRQRRARVGAGMLSMQEEPQNMGRMLSMRTYADVC